MCGYDYFLNACCANIPDSYRAKYWKNGVETFLTTGTTSQAAANSIFVLNSDIFIAGYETIGTPTTGTNTKKATVWQNGVKVSFAPVNSANFVNSEATSIFVTPTL